MLPKGRVGTSLAALLAAACLAVGGAAFAQDPGAGQSPSKGMPGAQKSAEDFSKDELQQFAAVQTEIQDIGKRYQSKVANAEGSSEMQKLQQSMQKEMVEVVQDSDIDVGTYNSIAKAARSNPELRKEIEGMSGTE